jgi:hypothetical protein
MATDGPTPVLCDEEVFQNGTPVALLDAPANATENWVKSVAEAADARLDWHYSGGVAQVLHLGDDESRSRVEDAITELEGSLNGRIMQRLPVGAAGLYRGGVTDAPEGAVASFYDGGDSSAYVA